MTLSLKEGAQRILGEAGEPLHYQELTKRLLDRGLLNPSRRRGRIGQRRARCRHQAQGEGQRIREDLAQCLWAAGAWSSVAIGGGNR